jgi:hypothetical protein
MPRRDWQCGHGIGSSVVISMTTFDAGLRLRLPKKHSGGVSFEVGVSEHLGFSPDGPITR